MEKMDIPNEHSLDSLEGNPERVPVFRVISDDQLKLLATHNVWASEKNQIDFDILNNSQDKKYTSESHPFFRKKLTGQKRDEENVNWIGSVKSLTGLRNYISFKRGEFVPVTTEEKEKILKAGPFGHGDNLGKAIDQELNKESTLTKGELDKMPILKYSLIGGPTYQMNGMLGPIIKKIESGEIHIKGYEEAYLSFIEDFIEIAPRFLTLLARDPKWDIRELEKYLETKNIPNVQFVVDLYKEENFDKVYQPLMDYARSVKVQVLPENGEINYLKYMQFISGAYKAIREYLEQVVTYE
jgi:hypothetical protein